MKNKGFTLVELLITITVFLAVITISLQLFHNAFIIQQKILNQNFLLNNISFNIEYISRALRMAQKGYEISLIDDKIDDEIGDEIKFLNYENKDQKFFLSNNEIRVEKEGETHSLTPKNLKVKKLKFKKTDKISVQPKVTFVIEIEDQKGQKINVQTTVSQRKLDF